MIFALAVLHISTLLSFALVGECSALRALSTTRPLGALSTFKRLGAGESAEKYGFIPVPPPHKNREIWTKNGKDANPLEKKEILPQAPASTPLRRRPGASASAPRTALKAPAISPPAGWGGATSSTSTDPKEKSTGTLLDSVEDDYRSTAVPSTSTSARSTIRKSSLDSARAGEFHDHDLLLTAMEDGAQHILVAGDPADIMVAAAGPHQEVNDCREEHQESKPKRRPRSSHLFRRTIFPLDASSSSQMVPVPPRGRRSLRGCVADREQLTAPGTGATRSPPTPVLASPEPACVDDLELEFSCGHAASSSSDNTTALVGHERLSTRARIDPGSPLLRMMDHEDDFLTEAFLENEVFVENLPPRRSDKRAQMAAMQEEQDGRKKGLAARRRAQTRQDDVCALECDLLMDAWNSEGIHEGGAASRARSAALPIRRMSALARRLL